VLLELLKHPPLLRKARDELDHLLGVTGEVSFQNLREMPALENVLKEVLRLHPPLIILMRKVSEDLHFKQYAIRAGEMIWACPPVTHRMSKLFSNPEAFDPDRFSPERREDRNLMAYQPFGGGKHKCSGNAFAMFQIKAIFAVLLRRYEFELVAAPETYVDDYTQMIVQPKSPCRVRYRRRLVEASTQPVSEASAAAVGGCPFHQQPATAVGMAAVVRIVVDRELCQGHAMCTGESPAHFRIKADGTMELVRSDVSGEELQKVEQAVRHCPNQALRVVREQA
jgi:sterol 14-demethylase